MLEKNTKNCLCDAHFHLFYCAENENLCKTLEKFDKYYACTCAHEQNEFLAMEKITSDLENSRSDKTIRFFKSFGLHPQNPIMENADFLEKLLKEKRICAIGETGFDLFTPDLKSNLEMQKKAWRIQLELATFYKVPIIIHCRKAIDFIFADISLVKKVPAVVFHSFSDALQQANSILGKGVNAYFSFGKPILNGNKKAIECVQKLGLSTLLLETDAPYQTLKGESFTSFAEIKRVYEAAFSLRKNFFPQQDEQEFYQAIWENFCCWHL